VSLAFDTIGYGEKMVVGYQATLSEDAADSGITVHNEVLVEWSTLSAPDLDDGIDDVERDREDGLVTDATQTITLTAPDYLLEKHSSADGPLNAGDPISYTLTVTNIGTHPGSNVAVSDKFPTLALGAPVAVSSDGVFNSATGNIEWVLPKLGINESITLTVDAVVAHPQSANIDGHPGTIDDVFKNTATVADDLGNGPESDTTNNTAQVSDLIIAAPDYQISKTNDITMVAPTEQLSYTVSASNNGTQSGTNVVITDVYPVDILTIVDPDNGTVDPSRGTISWYFSEFNVGQTETFTVIAEVLATASTDTADQLITNMVTIEDDSENGIDNTPENNEASESDRLVPNAGEPIFLAALPENTGMTATTAIPTLEGIEKDSLTSSESLQINTNSISDLIAPEIISVYSLKDIDENEIQRRLTFENDPINGGYLIDQITLPAPEIHCAPGHVTYEYQSDPESLELLNWLDEAETDEQVAPVPDAVSEEQGPAADETNVPKAIKYDQRSHHYVVLDDLDLVENENERERMRHLEYKKAEPVKAQE